MATPNTVVLRGKGIRKELPCSVAITPGMLVEQISDGTLIPHTTAAANATPAFAVENEVVGQEISVAYAIGDNVLYEVFPPGAEVYAMLPASAPAIVIGDFLESADNGYLRKHVPQAVDEGGTGTYNVIPHPIVARALEAVDNSSGPAGTRIRVEIV